MTNIVEALYSLYQQEPRMRRGRELTASDGLASACERFAWYEAHSPRLSVVSPLLKRRMNYGTLHEEHIRNELRTLGEKNGNSGDWQIKGAGLNLTLWGIKGRVDLLVKEEEKWKLLEVKTMNPEDFRKFQKNGLIAFPRYYEQFMFYLQALSLMPFKEPIKSGILLAENTFPLGELGAEELTVDLDCIAQMEAKRPRLQEVVSQYEPPPRPFTRDSSQCKKCWRAKECWELRSESRSISVEETSNPTEVRKAVLAWLEAKVTIDQEEARLDQAKSSLRTVLDEHKATDLYVRFSPEFSYHIHLAEVEVAGYWVESHNQVRLTIK